METTAQTARLIPNVAIMASAGTGKTFNLAMRYISLLLLGAKPEEIVAMTFSNKAAGEIFDKIVQELLFMCRRPDELATRIKKDLIPEGAAPDDLFRILRQILSMPQKLHIETIDSFFFKIIHVFPLECGISGPITMLNEADDEQRIRTLLTLLRDTSDDERRVLIEIIKQYSMGKEIATLFASADDTVKNYYSAYLKYPEKELWTKISGLADVSPEDIMTEKELEDIRRRLDAFSDVFTDRRGFSRLSEFMESAIAGIDTPTTPNLAPFSKPLTEDWLNKDLAKFSYYKDFSLDGARLKTVKRVVRHFLALECRKIMGRNEACYNLSRAYDLKYAQNIRKKGKLKFQDILFLLRPQEDSGSLELPFSERAVLEERLDAAYNHYLLDEFQDTSDEQWRAMSNLVDEVFQNAQDRFRSFFYVGDIKQSIYQWREGNPKLFGMIAEKYSRERFGENGLKISRLAKSYRSSSAVIESVNQVFLDPRKVTNTSVRSAMENMNFKKHESAASPKEQAGFSALIVCSGQTGMNKDVAARAIYNLLEAINPFSAERSFTVGVLAQGNDYIKKTSEDLRKIIAREGKSEKIAISAEGKMPLDSSMIFTAYRSLLSLALHPGDMMARGLLSMLYIEEKGCFLHEMPDLCGERGIDFSKWLERISGNIRDSIAANGFHAFLEHFIKVFEPLINGSDAKRLALALDTANAFDATGKSEIRDFLHTLDCTEGNTASVRKTVQFMTIHKSKGLDFDIVILPDLYGSNGIDAGREKTFILKKDSAFQPEWVSHKPASSLTSYFPAVAEALSINKAANTYEQCCKLYVAMTRARHALYILIPDEKPGNAYRFTKLLKETLSGTTPEAEEWIGQINERQIRKSSGTEEIPETMQLLYATGDPLWMEKSGETGKDSRAEFLKEAEKRFGETMKRYYATRGEAVNPPVRALPIRPSEHGPDSQLFTGNGAELGTHLHSLFAQIPFLDEISPEILLSRYLDRFGTGDKELADKIAAIFRNAIATGDAAELLNRPEKSAELWRERQFTTRLKGDLVSCVFDRVLLFRDAAGKIRKIQLVDYKSDRSGDPEFYRAAYSGQLFRYAEVLKSQYKVPVEPVIFMLRTGKMLKLT